MMLTFWSASSLIRGTSFCSRLLVAVVTTKSVSQLAMALMKLWVESKRLSAMLGMTALSWPGTLAPPICHQRVRRVAAWPWVNWRRRREAGRAGGGSGGEAGRVVLEVIEGVEVEVLCDGVVAVAIELADLVAGAAPVAVINGPSTDLDAVAVPPADVVEDLP